MPDTITPSVLPAPRDPDGPYTVSVVCTGNICRSAMAEVVLIDRLAAAGTPTSGRGGVVVTSAGVSDEEHGNPIDPRARRLLAERGYGSGSDAAARAVDAAIVGHAAHRIGDAELAGADLVLAMTSRHLSVLERLADRAGIEHEGAPASAADLLSVDAPRICLYRDLDPEGSGDVPDPWYGGHQDFLDTLEVIERVTPVIVDLVR